MSRIGYSKEEDYPGQSNLWQANCDRSLAGKKGQAALRRLEQALLALPDKRLIADRLATVDGNVCAIGALAKSEGRLEDFRRTKADQEDEHDSDYDDEEMEDVGVALGMPRLVAWKIVALNDIEIDGHCQDQYGPPVYRDGFPCRLPVAFIPVTPEERYKQMLAWVQARIKEQL